MSSEWGRFFKISIFGESHGAGIGVTIQGAPAGIPIDQEALFQFMSRRAPGKDKTSTPRKESDLPETLSGIFQGHTTGTPISALIRNQDTRSGIIRRSPPVTGPATPIIPGFCDTAGFRISGAEAIFPDV